MAAKELKEQNEGLRELLREALNIIYTANYLRSQQEQIDKFIQKCREADAAVLPGFDRRVRDELVACDGRVTEVGPPNHLDTCKVKIEIWGGRTTVIDGVPKERARDFLGRLVEVILRRV